MLNFNVAAGDDIWFGQRGQDLADYQQVFVKSIDPDGEVVVATPEEVITLPLGDQAPTTDIGIHGVKLVFRQVPNRPECFHVGIECPASTIALRGRVYRRNLDV